MNLKKLLEPKTIGVFGVSTSNPFHPANVIFTNNLLRYDAWPYGINPKGGTVYGQPLYRNISEVPVKVDLAVLAIRAEFVPDTLRQCAQAGVGAAIVISGGFAEAGHGDLQQQMIDIATEFKMPVLGPNCLGIFSPPHLDAFFLPHERLLEPLDGGTAIVSQSGGILVDLMIKLTQEGAGLSRAISIGNKAVIDEVDLLRFLERDKQTRVIGMYIEGFKQGRGRTFVETVKKMSKPVVVLKSGKTPGGSRAVSSHTASLAGDFTVFHEVIAQSGALEAENETAFVSYCEALANPKRAKGNNLCIVTGSGGHGAMASDAAYEKGLNLVDIPEADKQALREQLGENIRPICSLGNPVDLTGSARDADFIAACHFFLDKDYVDCILLLMLPYIPTVSSDIGARISLLAREHDKPIIVYIPHVEKYEIFVQGFEANGVPVSHSAVGAVFMAESLTKAKR